MKLIDTLHSSSTSPSCKFSNPNLTAKGEKRAQVRLDGLQTLWFNTGTLCNITCAHCYIESSPTNDRLAYLTAADVRNYLDEIAAANLPTTLLGFTGGEPFMNPEIMPMLELSLARGFQALVLTNAMRPMELKRDQLLALNARYGDKLRLRVSLDDPSPTLHDAERGEGAFTKALEGLRWLSANGFVIEAAGRRFSGEDDFSLRDRFAALFAELAIAINAHDPQSLVLFAEMDAADSPPEITEACWGILGKSPQDVMCASARMVVRRKGADAPNVSACTLLPYDARFDLGATLAQASQPVSLNHPFCAAFCVLGGSSCGSVRV